MLKREHCPVAFARLPILAGMFMGITLETTVSRHSSLREVPQVNALNQLNTLIPLSYRQAPRPRHARERSRG